MGTAVAVVGGGAVGRALAAALARGGADVTLALRDPAGAAEVPAGVAVAPLDEAPARAEVVVLAIPGAAVPGFAAAQAAALGDRIVVDATNDLSAGHAGPMHHMGDWARLAPRARVFRAFNTVGWENVLHPDFDGVAADLLWCGPDDGREVVEALIRGTGMRPVRAGGPEAADVLDGVARLWFALAFAQGMGRRLAFRVLGPSGVTGGA